jgi:hypothetical protein
MSMENKKWEYRMIYCPHDEYQFSKVSESGKEGWELAGISDNDRFWFKREITLMPTKFD